MDHHTGNRVLSITNTCNNRIYFLLLKFYRKMADVIIKPSKQLQVDEPVESQLLHFHIQLYSDLMLN